MVYQDFCEEIPEYGTPLSKWHVQSTLVEAYSHNPQTVILAQIGVAECRT